MRYTSRNTENLLAFGDWFIVNICVGLSHQASCPVWVNLCHHGIGVIVSYSVRLYAFLSADRTQPKLFESNSVQWCYLAPLDGRWARSSCRRSWAYRDSNRVFGRQCLRGPLSLYKLHLMMQVPKQSPLNSELPRVGVAWMTLPLRGEPTPLLSGTRAPSQSPFCRRLTCPLPLSPLEVAWSPRGMRQFPASVPLTCAILWGILAWP